MQKINEYILSLLIVSVTAGLIGMLLPDGEHDGIKRYVKYVISLGVTVTLLAPLGDVIYALPGMLDNMTEITQENREEVTLAPELYQEMTLQSAEAIENALEDEIQTRYNVHCNIKLELDTGDYMSIKITGAEIRINKSDSLYKDLIEKLIFNTLNCDIEWKIIE